MKFSLQLILTSLLCLTLQYFFPWWTLAIAAFTVAFLFDNKGFVSFAAGFLGVGIIWLGMAYYINYATDALLTNKLNQLLPINSLALTFLTGGLVGGFAGLTGALFRKL